MWGILARCIRATHKLPLSTLFIFLHSSAHCLHASAHFLQWSVWLCFSHSSAQALQMSSQSLHISLANSLSPANACIVNRETFAQSWLSLRQRAIFFKSPSLKQLFRHCRQAITQAEQAAIQLSIFFCFIFKFYLLL